MARKSTIRLLAVTPADHDAERLVSLFRNAGRVARVQHLAATEELLQALAEDAELLVIQFPTPGFDAPLTLAQVRERAPDLPILVIEAQGAVAALTAAGAAAVLEPGDDERLVAAALRELSHLEARRELAELHTRLGDVETRNALLLAEAQDAIAYITDGMVIHANPLFAQRFSCDDPDDLDCTPIVDLIAPADHDKIKALLKRVGTGETLESPARCLGPDGDGFDAMLQLSPAVYDGESCAQLVLKADTGSGAREAVPLEANLNSLAALGGSIACVAVDHFEDLRARLGLAASHALRAQLAGWLQEQLGERGRVLPCGDDLFALSLPGLSSDEAMELAEQLCKRTGEHIIEVAEQSLQCTLSIGIATLSAAASSAPAEALEQAFAAASLARKEGGSRARRPDLGSLDGVLPTDVSPEQTLEEALEQKRFVLLFQPVVSLRGAAGEYYEVLLRMRDDQGDEIVPDNFIEALGSGQAKGRLDRWLIMEATKRLAERRAEGGDIRLIINLSEQALQDDSLLPWLGVVIKAAGIPPEALIWQLAETDICHNLKQAQELRSRLSEIGCQVSVGHFGRSPDPVKTLRHVGADLVQIDGAFTRELQNKGDPALLKALVAGVSELSVRVVIPCVENAGVLAVLWQMGIDYIQGHYLQAPAHTMDYEFSDIT